MWDTQLDPGTSTVTGHCCPGHTRGPAPQSSQWSMSLRTSLPWKGQGKPRTPLPREGHCDSLLPLSTTLLALPQAQLWEQEPQDSPSSALEACTAFPIQWTGPPQHFRTPKVPSSPSTAPPAPSACLTHIIECITVPLFLQLVKRGVEEAKGCQPPLQTPVVDQCHHACHHGCGCLRGHNPSAQDPTTAEGSRG